MRHLTGNEIIFLYNVYKNTLRYRSIGIGEADVGAEAITPSHFAYFSTRVYCEDFSKAGAYEQWVFVHEMMHVWQWGHHFYQTNNAIALWIINGGNYRNAYPYVLTPGKKLTEYNVEQQASIVADYWGLSTGRIRAQDNKDFGAKKEDYTELIAQLQSSGPSLLKESPPL